jgi:hypothetical protein
MQQHRGKNLAVVAALALPLALGACDDAFGIGDDRFEGRYEYDGDVLGASFYSVEGEIRIRNERRDEADVDLHWTIRDADRRTVFFIDSSTPARAYIRGDYIEFEFEGRLDNGVDFVLEHEGELRGRTIIGAWYLDTETGSERGEFRAVR